MFIDKGKYRHEIEKSTIDVVKCIYLVTNIELHAKSMNDVSPNVESIISCREEFITGCVNFFVIR